METKLYDTVEAAEFLGVSRERVSQLCRDGLLQSKTYGRARLIAEPDLVAFSQKDRKAGRPKKEVGATAPVVQVVLAKKKAVKR